MRERKDNTRGAWREVTAAREKEGVDREGGVKERERERESREEGREKGYIVRCPVFSRHISRRGGRLDTLAIGIFSSCHGPLHVPSHILALVLAHPCTKCVLSGGGEIQAGVM